MCILKVLRVPFSTFINILRCFTCSEAFYYEALSQVPFIKCTESWIVVIVFQTFTKSAEFNQFSISDRSIEHGCKITCFWDARVKPKQMAGLVLPGNWITRVYSATVTSTSISCTSIAGATPLVLWNHNSAWLCGCISQDFSWAFSCLVCIFLRRVCGKTQVYLRSIVILYQVAKVLVLMDQTNFNIANSFDNCSVRHDRNKIALNNNVSMYSINAAVYAQIFFAKTIFRAHCFQCSSF